MMNITIKNQIIPIAIALAAIPVYVQAATYSVSKSGNDGNSCATAQSTTQSLQKRTIPAALRCLTLPGDTLLIHSGTYVERLFEVDFGATGTSWATPMTVAAYPGETVTLQVTPGGDNVVRFQNGAVHHVEIRDLIIDGTGGSETSTIAYVGPGSHHLRFRRVELRDGRGHGLLGFGQYHEFIDMTVHNIGASSAYNINVGMYMVTDNALIHGGKFYNNECYGIRFWDSDTTQSADNNVIDGAMIYNNGMGIGNDGASQCGAGGGAITLADSGNVVRNSIIYGNYYGIELFHYQEILDAQIYNNTIVGNQIIGLYIPYEAKRTLYKNNIVFNNGTGNISDNGIASVSMTNLTSNPLFTDVAGHDFTLQPGSPARDAGTSIASVTLDYTGVARAQGSAYDIGAYEYKKSGSATPPLAPAQLTITGH
jgi:Right handed beta helix region